MVDPSLIDDRAKLAFQFASDVAKQLITISTALIAFSVTFTKELLKGTAPTRYLYASLAAHLASIVCGVWTLLALTGTLMPIGGYAQASAATFDANVRVPAFLQVAAFIVGAAALVAHGVLAIRRRADTP